MLIELHITDFAIIDQLTLPLRPGFNVLTGETGAGKSIIIDAVGALLGGRLGVEFVRSGAEVARVEGIFGLEGAEQLDARLASEYGIEPDAEDHTLILSRELHRSGRSICRVNGRIVPTNVLQALGQELVDIHGQSEHLSLLRASRHVDFLDRYAGLQELRAAVADAVLALRTCRRELQKLVADDRETARRMDLLRYQIDEIQSAGLVPDEDRDLLGERTRLQNAERIMSLADLAYAALYAGGEEQRPAVELLAQAEASLRELTRLDPAVAEAAAQAESLGFQVEELARTIRAYRDGVEHNPDRLEQVEERLTLIHNLKRKYGSSIAEIMAYRDRAAADLDAMSHSEERIAELKAREGELLAEVGRLAGTLSQARREAGKRLAEAVESELAGLNMHKVRFQVEIAHQPDPEGVILDGASEPVTVTATGADVVEFLISPNPGEPLKPLARIASGGETSRLMLALKSILSQADPVSTLIFDEIDQGVGGRSGHIVGEKLWALSSRHQVICVTHLPQIACFGDTHFSIVKQTAGDRTVTRVQELTGEARVAELAEMLGGAREPGRQAARAMLQQTEGRKAAIRPAPPG